MDIKEKDSFTAFLLRCFMNKNIYAWFLFCCFQVVEVCLSFSKKKELLFPMGTQLIL